MAFPNTTEYAWSDTLTGGADLIFDARETTIKAGGILTPVAGVAITNLSTTNTLQVLVGPIHMTSKSDDLSLFTNAGTLAAGQTREFFCFSAPGFGRGLIDRVYVKGTSGQTVAFTTVLK